MSVQQLDASDGHVPDVIGFSSHWQQCKEQVLEHVRDQDAAYRYLSEIEYFTWDQLGEVGQYPLMDREYGTAIEALLTHKLKTDLTLARDKARINGTRVRGRQIAWMYWHSFAITQENANKLQTQKLENVHLRGDDLRTFVTNATE